MIVEMLYDKGLRADHCYDAALVSVGLALVSWATSVKTESHGVERADRWGIFVGEWAPTFFGLGLALAHHEKKKT
ncbi:hypothetical protein [Streptomyces sp. CA2R106]|uniref:hypothetical protein n=1 Tax=Streptomyces sp. CA2R106 TaxID=3120153 RepID=UPI00300B0A94